jgi:hypothetical protein
MMEDLTKEEIVQLLNFYKNKSIDLEFSFLLLQLNSKKEITKKEEEFKKILELKEEQYNVNLVSFKLLVEKLKEQNNKKTKTANVKNKKG